MFDKDGIKNYVGGDSGNSYSAGLNNIERKYAPIDIDQEFDKDECAELLDILEKAKFEPNLIAKEKSQRQDNYSHLKKYIWFMRYKRFIQWLSNHPQKNDNTRHYSLPTAKGAADCLHKKMSLLSVPYYKDTDCFSINAPDEFSKLYDICYDAAKEYDIKNGHSDFRNGLDFYLEFLQGGRTKMDANNDPIKEKIKEVVSDYTLNFQTVNADERYKWEAIGHYKKHWNIDADDFSAMYGEAFKKANNLLAAGMYYPYKMIVSFADNDPEKVRSLFVLLYDESIPLADRYTKFRAGCEELLTAYRESNPSHSKAMNHYQDLHAVSVYLAFEYPEVYYIYKFKVYKGFRERIGFPEDNIANKSEVRKLENYNTMCDTVLSVITQDDNLLSMSAERLDDTCYQDEAHHLLAMDIVYFGSKNLGSESKEQIVSDYWPSSEEYDPHIDKATWLIVLNDSSVTSVENLTMLKMILEQGGESTCANLAECYGNIQNYYNKLGSSYGEKVKNKLNCPDCIYGDKIRYYPIPFVGRDVVENGAKRYSWKLRDELKAALEEMDLSNIEISNNETVTDVPKNTILYGPPGTGKTYNTVIYAVAIVEGKPLSTIREENYDDVLDRYNEYKANELIEFTTFHQSYGYEEFIEGIKPVMQNDDDEQTDIQYEIASGLFKNFCDKAGRPVLKQQKVNIGLNNSPTIWKVSLEGTGDNPTREECLENNHIRVGYDSYGENISSDTNFTDGGKTVVNAFIYKMRIGDVVLSCYSSTTVDAIGVVTGDYEWHDEFNRYKRLRKVNWIVKGIREDITAINNGSTLTLSSVYKLNIALADVMDIISKNASTTTEASEKKKNYVFIIDEINRGNISKIFGELITLIEPTKRIGQAEGMKARLPYSQKSFGVPDNVYLIGTMNTAGRSIATIDTALRRRFKFKEMMPDADVLDGVNVEDLSIKEMLLRMNNKISILYDREHTIGHAYFVPLRANPTIETLASIFSDNIIPLLQEYFFDDYEKIRLVLGDNNKQSVDEQFITAKSVDFGVLFGNTDFDFDDATNYEINYSAFDNIEAYRFI